MCCLEHVNCAATWIATISSISTRCFLVFAEKNAKTFGISFVGQALDIFTQYLVLNRIKLFGFKQLSKQICFGSQLFSELRSQLVAFSENYMQK